MRKIIILLLALFLLTSCVSQLGYSIPTESSVSTHDPSASSQEEDPFSIENREVNFNDMEKNCWEDYFIVNGKVMVNVQ